MSLWSKLVLFTCLQVSRRRLNLTETSPSFSPHKCAPPQVFLLVEIPLPPPWTELLMKKDEGFWFILSPLCPRLSLHVHPSLQPRPHFLLPLRPPCSCAPESPSGNAQACASPTPGSPRHLLWLPEPPWSDLSLVSRSPPDIPSRGPSISTPSLPWSSKAFCQEIFCPGSFFLLRCQHRCLLVLQGHPSTLPAHLTAHLQPHPPISLPACCLFPSEPPFTAQNGCFLLHQLSTNDWQNLVYQYPSSPSHRIGKVRNVCVHRVPAFTQIISIRDEVVLLTVVAVLMRCPYFSWLLDSLVSVPLTTDVSSSSQINILHLNPCPPVCFLG